MTTTERYSVVINNLNEHIISFNAFLADKHKLKKIAADDPSTYLDVVNRGWCGEHWPSKDNAGVYILCGRHELDHARLGVYIGKASLQNIGYRLWSHLKDCSASGVYKIGGSSRESFLLEAILAIPISTAMPRSIASALEEYIISNGLENIHLLNVVAKRPNQRPPPDADK